MTLLKRLLGKDKSSTEAQTASDARRPISEIRDGSQESTIASQGDQLPLDQEDTKHSSRMIVGIPGLWHTEQDLMRALLEDKESELMLMGPMCFDPRAREHCWVEMRGFDPGLRKAFEVAGRGRISNETLDRIGQHEYCAYLIFDDPSPEKAKTAVRFINAFLRAGGIAVKVESAGTAHDEQTWTEKAARLDDYDLYSLFIVLVGSRNRYYSCGMQNFGLPDAEVFSLDEKEAAHILNEFNVYRLTENPKLRDGDFITLPPGSRFEVSWHEYEGYDPETPLYNSWGRWLLEPLPVTWLVKGDDPQMAEAFAEARSTIEQFIQALQNPKPSQSLFSVKVPIGDGENIEYIWLHSVQIQGSRFMGIVDNEPSISTDVSVGDRVSVAREEISDWMYVEEGKLTGGFTLHALRNGMSQRERFEFDRSMPFAME